MSPVASWTKNQGSLRSLSGLRTAASGIRVFHMPHNLSRGTCTARLFSPGWPRLQGKQGNAGECN